MSANFRVLELRTVEPVRYEVLSVPRSIANAEEPFSIMVWLSLSQNEVSGPHFFEIEDMSGELEKWFCCFGPPII